MKIGWPSRGLVVDMEHANIDTLPSLRLVAYHAPKQRIEVTTTSGTYYAPLGELDLDCKRVRELNSAPKKPEESSGIHEVCPPTTITIAYPPDNHR